MKAVLLDGYTINPGDLSWDKLGSLCDEFTVYDSSYNDDLVPRDGHSARGGLRGRDD